MSSTTRSSDGILGAKIRAKELLRARKLNVTQPRIEILSLLLKKHGPFSVEEILQQIPANTCDQATVYRCLAQFQQAQLVSEVKLGENFSRFEFLSSHHHHHVICRLCQNIETLNKCYIDPFLQHIREMGYTDVQHQLEFSAICSECQKN